MTSFVIDASVVIKWVVQEDGSEDAVRLIDGPTLRAPDLLMPEYATTALGLMVSIRRSPVSKSGTTRPQRRKTSIRAG